MTEVEFNKHKSERISNFKTSQGLKIMRVFEIHRLLALCKSNQNTLVKPRLWDDPFENYLQKVTFKYNDVKLYYSDNFNRFYGQCWTCNTDETDAFWRIYAPHKQGVVVKTTVEKFWNSFCIYSSELKAFPYYFGKIEYLSVGDIKRKVVDNHNYIMNPITSPTTLDYNIANNLFLKRIEFSHENEIRFLYGENENTGEDFFRYKIEPQELIDEVIFDPRLEDIYYDIFCDTLVKLGIDNSKIKKSDLYSLGDLTINTGENFFS